VTDGSSRRPFKTISAAARLAPPGEVVTVHAGTYRERVMAPRGGESNTKRITYQAAPGEEVIIKGSETVKGWTQFRPGIWKAVIPFDGPHFLPAVICRAQPRNDMSAQCFHPTTEVHSELGNNLGIIAPKNPIKPRYRTEDKAKRANKIAFLG